ncbi:MAG: DUF732 domain-containing protein [Mycobacterium sp.]
MLATVGCGAQTTETAVTETVTETSTSTVALYGDALLGQRLRDGNMTIRDEDLPAYIPMAHQVCSLIDGSTAPVEDQYANTVNLLHEMGSEKDVFSTIYRTAVFVDGSIMAYCPQYVGLIP